MNWMLSKFKEINPAACKTRCVMADKDLVERQLLKEHFQEANVLICTYHTLRTFNREITTQKMRITSKLREDLLEVLQGMVMAKPEERFDDLEEKFFALAPCKVRDYYSKNWRPIKHEWFRGPRFMEGTFNNTTNNRLENLNGQIKNTMGTKNCLKDFFIHIFKLIGGLKQEHKHNNTGSQKMLSF
ncbi:uncharacterized protein LOC135395786 [Ornithodoros turicata]|uniref:uncharacterized protein LOC135395786 n=1 Tax=Ornithodoros turicata TaxID=34597 RepID=UPI0031389857